MRTLEVILDVNYKERNRKDICCGVCMYVHMCVCFRVCVCVCYTIFPSEEETKLLENCVEFCVIFFVRRD